MRIIYCLIFIFNSATTLFGQDITNIVNANNVPKAARTIKSEDNKFLVEISIYQGTSGYAKIQEYVPFGYTAKRKDTEGSAFSFYDNTNRSFGSKSIRKDSLNLVKFSWMGFPNKDSVKVSYYLIPLQEQNMLSEPTIYGDYSYLYRNGTNKMHILTREVKKKVKLEPSKGSKTH